MATVTKTFSRADVETLSRRLGEPDWLLEHRLEAWAHYAALDLPGRTDEQWRRTDLTGLDLALVSPEVPAGAPDTVPEPWLHVDGSAGPLLVLRNGRVVRRELAPGLAGRGLIVTDLETACRQHPDLVRKYLLQQAVRPDTSIFTALHAALFRGGAFVYVPPGMQVAEPIQILTWADGQGAGLLNHTLVVVDEDAAASVMEHCESPDFDRMVVQLGVTELVTRRAARLRYACVQNWGAGTWSFHHRRAHVGRDSNVEWVTADFGADLARSEQHLGMDEEGGEANLRFVFFGTDEQHHDVVATTRHTASHTTSDINGRGVLGGRARAVFRGVAHVVRGARQSRCHQHAKTLLLSEKARADAIPSLYIDHDDVLGAGHGATTGHIDHEQLFYLRSRGIPEQEARRLIIEGFLSPVLDEIALPTLRESLKDLIDRKLQL